MISRLKIMNYQAFIGVFGNIPDLVNSELLEVEIKRDGPTVFIKILTIEKVITKPKRWDTWDVIYIDMSFLGVKNLEINGLGTNNIINQFEIKDSGEYGELEIKCNNEMHIKCLFDWARIENISPGLIGLK